MKDRDQELVKGYTALSSRYDNIRFLPFLEDFMTAALLELLEICEGLHVLDVAAGTGRMAVPFASAGATVIAIDLTSAMIAQMLDKAQRLDLSTLHVQQANARFLPFPDNAFDLVISLRFLHLFNLKDQAILLEEMHRVVKPGGRVLIEYNNAGALWVGSFVPDIFRRLNGKKPLSRVTRSRLEELYRDFEVVRIQGFSWPFVGMIARVSPSVARWLLQLSMRDEVSKYARYNWVVSAKLG